MNEPMLNEAKRIAGQSVTDRLDGKQGEEARSVMTELLKDAGLDFGEAYKLLEAYGWERYSTGFQAARSAYWNRGA
jgi:hypothetical protein